MLKLCNGPDSEDSVLIQDKKILEWYIMEKIVNDLKCENSGRVHIVKVLNWSKI